MTKHTLARIRENANTAREALERRDALIIKAREEGAPAIEIAQASGLSRARIYQIITEQ